MLLRGKFIFFNWSLVAVVFSVFILISVILSISFSPVRGDGLFQEQLSASLGDRKADLLIKMNQSFQIIKCLSAFHKFNVFYVSLMCKIVVKGADENAEYSMAFDDGKIFTAIED